MNQNLCSSCSKREIRGKIINSETGITSKNKSCELHPTMSFNNITVKHCPNYEKIRTEKPITVQS